MSSRDMTGTGRLFIFETSQKLRRGYEIDRNSSANGCFVEVEP
jgi:hypothetical protein